MPPKKGPKRTRIQNDILNINGNILNEDISFGPVVSRYNNPPLLMEDARCKTIELGSERIDALGGAQPSRIPMTQAPKGPAA